MLPAQAPNGFRLNLHIPLRLALAVALLATFAAPGTAVAKKPGFFCQLAPGKTYVNWRDQTQATRVDLGWFDVDGNVVDQRTFIPAEERRSTFKVKTPTGAVDFGVTYSDASGVYAVGGMFCQ